jgi:ABC-type Zn uptake system ZnuABC Zn-binding protein ZnuA
MPGHRRRAERPEAAGGKTVRTDQTVPQGLSRFEPIAHRSTVAGMRRAAGGVLALAAALGVLAACGDDGASGAGDGRLLVVTTVAPITSIVGTIAGDDATVVGVVPEGTNSHTFEPKPSVAELLSDADVVVVNGLQLEEPTRELAEDHLHEGAEIVDLGAAAIDEDEWIFDRSFPRSDGKPNPHLWTDPVLAKRYANQVRDVLVRRDPERASGYRARTERLLAQMEALDAAMRAAFATVPTRTLVTYHDAYAYVARDYGWTILDAIQVADFQDPTPREVADLIDQIRDRRVPAIFGSEVFPSPVLEQIARESGARYVDDLRDDDLPGRPGDPEHSWLGLLRFDYATMTAALGGDPSAIEAVRPDPELVDRAEYPQ